jgi:hypothetical protein
MRILGGSYRIHRGYRRSQPRYGGVFLCSGQQPTLVLESLFAQLSLIILRKALIYLISERDGTNDAHSISPISPSSKRNDLRVTRSSWRWSSPPSRWWSWWWWKLGMGRTCDRRHCYSRRDRGTLLLCPTALLLSAFTTGLLPTDAVLRVLPVPILPTIRIMEPRYPDITVKLIGQDGNAFAILARCRAAMRRAGRAARPDRRLCAGSDGWRLRSPPANVHKVVRSRMIARVDVFPA